MERVFYIHGANSTPLSFAYLEGKLPEHETFFFRYGHNRPVLEAVSRLVADIERVDEPVTLVGHSLGGVIAVVAAMRCAQVKKVITIASPLGGSEAATWMRWFRTEQLFHDIHPYSPLMREVRAADFSINVEFDVLSIVTTEDGVVSVASQKALCRPTYVELPLNHFEILLSDETAGHIESFLFEGAR